MARPRDAMMDDWENGERIAAEREASNQTDVETNAAGELWRTCSHGAIEAHPSSNLATPGYALCTICGAFLTAFHSQRSRKLEAELVALQARLTAQGDDASKALALLAGEVANLRDDERRLKTRLTAAEAALREIMEMAGSNTVPKPPIVESPAGFGAIFRRAKAVLNGAAVGSAQGERQCPPHRLGLTRDQRPHLWTDKDGNWRCVPSPLTTREQEQD